ncbi:MFS general substrate transporter, partial [Aspergillus ellipticus CBS 707.79]
MTETKEQTGNEPTIPPEGGIRGWMTVAGAFCALFSSFGFLNAIGVFQTTYQETSLKDYDASDISWIFALQLALMWAPGPLWGRIIDTYGPVPVLWPCSVLCVLGLCMTSLATKYYEILLAQGLCFGIGAGGVFTSSMICVGQWFVRQRGLATGIAVSGSSLGGVIFPIFLNRVIEDVGFYGAVRYTALFVGVMLVFACMLVRNRLPRKKWDGKAAWIDLTLLKDGAFGMYTAGAFFIMLVCPEMGLNLTDNNRWGLWAPFDYLSSMAENAGFSSTLALYLISIINGASVFGRIIPPQLADMLGHFNVLTVCCFGTGASMLCLWLPFNYHPSHAGIIVFSAVYGFVSGSVVSLLMPCVAKVGDLQTLGQRFGTFQLVMSLACLTGLPIMGAILQKQNYTDYSGLQLFGACCGLLGATLVGGSTLLIRKRRGSKKV